MLEIYIQKQKKKQKKKVWLHLWNMVHSTKKCSTALARNKPENKMEKVEESDEEVLNT